MNPKERLRHALPRQPGLQKKIAVICVSMLLASSLLLAEKTDKVVLRNGNEITGEIKKLDRGKLEYSTDDIGRIYIEWDQVYRIASKGRFHIELEDGRAYFGSIEDASEAGRMVIVGNTKYEADVEIRIEEDLLSVVRITPMETRFYERLKGYLDVGFGFQKAHNLTTLSVGGDLTYHAKKWEMTFTASSYYSKQTDADSTRRHNFSLSGKRFLPKRWSGNVLTRFEHNKELNLDRRASLAAGMGRNLIQNNRMILMLAGGLSVNNEKYSNEDSSVNNLEALGVLDFQTFRYNDPEMDISATLRIFPSLTDFGRVRIQFETRVQYEIFKDIFWGLGFFDNFDSRPPGQAAENVVKNDLGIETTINWKFK
ncbi:MAG: DUF481 domain-containing protein [Candidatus Aminicenantaceae bacterium]